MIVDCFVGQAWAPSEVAQLLCSLHSVLGWREEIYMVVLYDFFCVGTFIDRIDEALHDDALAGVIIGWRGWRDDTLTFTLINDWESP